MKVCTFKNCCIYRSKFSSFFIYRSIYINIDQYMLTYSAHICFHISGAPWYQLELIPRWYERRWILEGTLLAPCLEIIFICIGIVSIVLGSIISIWTNLDSEFQNLHKPALNENDNKISSVPSKHVNTKIEECQTLQTTNATSVSKNISNRHEGSIKSKFEI